MNIMRLMIVALLVMTIQASDIANATITIEYEAELEARGIDTSFENLSLVIADNSFDLNTRAMSAIAIGRSNHASAYDLLASGVSSGDPILEGVALQGLIHLNDVRALGLYAEVLNGNHSGSHKQLAISGLAKLKTADADAALISAALVHGQEHRAVLSIVEYFRARAGNEADFMFQSLLDHEDEEVSARAVMALSNRYPGNYEDQLIHSVLSSSLPFYLWTEIVGQLELEHGRAFGNVRVDELKPNDEGISEKKRQINKNIKQWSLERDN